MSEEEETHNQLEPTTSQLSDTTLKESQTLPLPPSSSPLQTTPDDIPFEQLMENIESGARDAIETGDYLSYSTLLDIYLSDPLKYTNAEKESLLQRVLDTLKQHTKLTYEIGWDLPNLIIAYVDLGYDFNRRLRDAPCVYKIMKIFEVLALEGNPKELFLKSCELLQSLRVYGGLKDEEEDEEEEEEEEEEEGNNEDEKKHTNVIGEDDKDSYKGDDIIMHKENVLDIKLYCVINLVDACMKRIHTLYPSRFLAMAISSFVNLVYNLNKIEGTHGHFRFVLQRAYTFIRNYTGLPEPKDLSEYSAEDLKKIREDESYLQRRLLTGFVTNVITMCTTQHPQGFAMDYFNTLQQRGPNHSTYTNEHDRSVLERWAELAYSFDLYLKTDFEKFVQDSRKFILSTDLSKDKDEAMGILFERCIIDYQKYVHTNIVNNSANKTIQTSILGELILYTNKVLAVPDEKKEQKSQKKLQGGEMKLSLSDVIYTSIRLLIPQIVQPTFVQKSVSDVLGYWTWVALANTSANELRLELATVPSALLPIYYLGLLFLLMQSQDKPTWRYMLLTLLTKLLFLSPEEVGYAFIKDSLENCPYEQVKVPLLGIFKELVLQLQTSVDQLDMSKASIKDEKESDEKPNKGKVDSSEFKPEDKGNEKQTAPTLPPRANSSSPKQYYTLNLEKVEDFVHLMLMAQTECFAQRKDDKTITINPGKLSPVAAYLNFFVVLKRNDAIVKGKENVERVLRVIEGNLNSVKENSGNQFEKNAAIMLQLSIDRFRE